MSTKIYNGYRVTPIFSLSKLLEFNNDFRTKILQSRKKLILDLFTNYAIHRVDKRTVGLDKDTNPVFSQIYQEILERIEKVKKTNYRDPVVDFQCEVVYIPLDNQILALLYTEQKEFTKIWESLPQVKDYHYQNQVDKPKIISTKEWNQRTLDWDKALPLNRPPSQSGFTFTCSDLEIWEEASVKNILNNLPTFDTRVNYIAQELLQSQKLTWENLKDTTQILHQLESFSAWCKTSPGKAELDKIKTQVKALLKPVLTAQDLS